HRGFADIRWRRTVMTPEGTVGIRQVGEAGFRGDIGDLTRAPTRIAQERCALYQAPFQHMMREAPAGLLQEEMHVARRDAERRRDHDRIQALIAAAAFDLTQ